MRSTLNRGALIAGGSALALFAVMFIDWFADGGQAADLARRAQEAAEQLGLDPNEHASGAYSPENGWLGLGWLQLLLVGGAMLSAFAFAVVTFTQAAVSTPIALSAIVTGIGILAFFAVLFSLINPPGNEIDRQLGLYLGLVASAGIVLGGYLGMQEERPGFSGS